MKIEDKHSGLNSVTNNKFIGWYFMAMMDQEQIYVVF